MLKQSNIFRICWFAWCIPRAAIPSTVFFGNGCASVATSFEVQYKFGCRSAL